MESLWTVMESARRTAADHHHVTTKRKRVAESTGLLEDMLAFVSEDNMASTDQGSTPALLPYLDDETLQFIYEDIPLQLQLPIENQGANNQNLYHTPSSNPVFSYSNSTIEELSNVKLPILNPSYDHSQQAAAAAAFPPPSPTVEASTIRTLHTGPRPPARRKGTPSYREAHIHSERQRRQDMTGLFNTLRSLLPNMEDNDQFKGDRCTVLGYVIDYVQQLDKKVQELGSMRAQLLKLGDQQKRIKQEEEAAEPIKKCHRSSVPTNEIVQSTDVSVRFWGHVDIFITLNSPKQRGVWPHLLAFLQDTLQLDVQNVTLSATPFFFVHSIYAKVIADEDQNREVSCEKLREVLGQFLAAQHSVEQ